MPSHLARHYGTVYKGINKTNDEIVAIKKVCVDLLTQLETSTQKGTPLGDKALLVQAAPDCFAALRPLWAKNIWRG